MLRIIAGTLLCSMLVIGSGQAGDKAFIWGANGHPFTAYPGVEYEKQLDILRDLGLTSYRVNVSHAEDIPRLVELAAKA